MGITAGIAAVATGVGGAVISSNAAKSASKTQAASAGQANQLEQHMFDTTQANLSPYVQGGAGAYGNLMGMVPQLSTGMNPMPPGFSPFNPNTPQFNPANYSPPQFQMPGSATPPAFTPFNPTMGQLEQTPGYQFTLDQGLKAINNQNSAKGWSLSGAGNKSIADYATGLASNTYQQQYGNYMQNYQTALGANQLNYGNLLSGYGAQLQGSQAGFENSLRSWVPQFEGMQQTFSNNMANYQAGQQNFQTGFGNYWGQNQNIYGMLYSPVALGETAAAGQGQIGAAAAGAMGNNLIGAGNALGAGQLGAANAWAGAPSSAMGNYMLLNQLMNPNVSAGGGYGGNGGSPYGGWYGGQYQG